MLIDTSLIGASSEPQTFEATEEVVRRFMEATEDPALQSDTPISFVPLTFPTTFRGPQIPELVIDRSKMQVLHGEQEYHYTRPLRIGEQVTCTMRIVDIRERTGRSAENTCKLFWLPCPWSPTPSRPPMNTPAFGQNWNRRAR